MTTQRFLTATLGILASTACGAFQHSPAVQVSARDATLNTRWHANLASPASLAGVVQMNGSASMAPSPDSSGTNVTLDLANASPGGLHPWAVHYGQCGDNMDRGVFGSLEMYSPAQGGFGRSRHRQHEPADADPADRQLFRRRLRVGGQPGDDRRLRQPRAPDAIAMTSTAV